MHPISLKCYIGNKEINVIEQNYKKNNHKEIKSIKSKQFNNKYKNKSHWNHIMRITMVTIINELREGLSLVIFITKVTENKSFSLQSLHGYQ